MFDFTPNVALEPSDRKLYQKLRLALYFVFFALALYLSYLIVFPSKYFFFNLSEPTSNKNSLANVKLSDSAYPENGFLAAGEELRYGADITNDYSSAQVKITLQKDSENPANPSISVRRSYQAFMYPEGEAIGFKEGSLLLEGMNYYIISDGQLRKFASPAILNSLGYSPANFKVVSKEELSYNPHGETLDKVDFFPNGAIFKIENEYYILSEQKLKKFTGENPFLTQYDQSQALNKSQDFLQKYPVSEDSVGFSDGTLVSSVDSVFIISRNKFFPIDSVQTFEIKGFHWEDVVPAGTDELAIYEKEKLFNLKGVHPDGTIYKSIEDTTYYLVWDGKKHILPSEKIATSWNKMTPIAVSEKALEGAASCSIKKAFFNSNTFVCEIPLESFAGLPGGNYEFTFRSNNAIHLKYLDVEFEKKITKDNLKFFLIGLYNSILANYAKTAL